MPGAPGPEAWRAPPIRLRPRGRAAEVAAIRRMLDGGPLVTVTGLPGVGKTAVGLAAASAAASGFADGSLLLRLDGLRDEALLPHTIAAALRLPDDFTRGRLPVLVEQLRDRHLLLILDTCEHLLGACAALVAALLPPCPKMQVLATSREPLRVPGETTVAVRPLRLADAVELFGRRAARAGAVIAPEHRAAVASVCVQLDKLPLAIELAAAELAGRHATGRNSRWPSCWPSWRRGTTCRAATASRDGTGRCGRRSAGATSCARRPSACCGPGSRCSPARSAGRTRRTCAAATSCPPRPSRPA